MDVFVAIRDTNWEEGNQAAATLSMLRSMGSHLDPFLTIYKSILPDRQMIPWIVVMSHVLDAIKHDEALDQMRRFVDSFVYDNCRSVLPELGVLLHKFCIVAEFNVVIPLSDNRDQRQAPIVSKSRAIPTIELLYDFSVKFSQSASNSGARLLTPVHSLLMKLCWQTEFLVYAHKTLSNELIWRPDDQLALSGDEVIDFHIFSALVFGSKDDYQRAKLHFIIALKLLSSFSTFPDESYSGHTESTGPGGSIGLLSSIYLPYLPKLLCFTLLSDLTLNSLRAISTEVTQGLNRQPCYNRYSKLDSICKSRDQEALSQLLVQHKKIFEDDGSLELLYRLKDVLDYAKVVDSSEVYSSRRMGDIFSDGNIGFHTLELFENVKVSDKKQVLRFPQSKGGFDSCDINDKLITYTEKIVQALEDLAHSQQLVGNQPPKNFGNKGRILQDAELYGTGDLQDVGKSTNKRSRSNSRKPPVKEIASVKAAKMKGLLQQEQDPEEYWSSDSHMGDSTTAMDEDDYDEDDENEYMDTEMAEISIDNDDRG